MSSISLSWETFNDAPGIFLVEDRLSVIHIIAYGIIEHGEPHFHLGLSVLDDLYIAGLAVLIRQIIGDVYLFPVALRPVPLIQEAGDLVRRNRMEEIETSGVAVYPHVFCEQRMVVCIVRIILVDVVLRDDGVNSKILEQAKISFREIHSEYLIQLIVLDDLTNHDIRTDKEAAAPPGDIFRYGQFHVRKVRQKCLVWLDHRPVFRQLTDRCPFGVCDLFLRGVCPVVLIFDIGGPALFL